MVLLLFSLCFADSNERNLMATVGGYDSWGIKPNIRYKIRYVTATTEIELGAAKNFFDASGGDAAFSDTYDEATYKIWISNS